MKTLLALNLVFLVFAVSAQSSAPVMRMSALEVVDERGETRLTLKEPGGKEHAIRP